MARKWGIFQDVREWRYIEEFGRCLWVSVSNERITQARDTQEEANKDFENLGYIIKDGAAVQCYDNIIKGKVWERYIVQSYEN